jgi:hypothetical protein
MWIFTKAGLISVVQNTADKNMLLVRARQPHHLTDNFKGTIPQYTPEADYRYRIHLSKDEFAKQLTRLVSEIDYPNFKNAADPIFIDIYARIWRMALQLEEITYARVYPVDFDSGQSSRPLDPY